MKYRTKQRLLAAGVVLYVLAAWVLTFGVIYVAIHFIQKYW